ncbi:hypothetical protein [Vibrio sonorensis]|uniref:hypothetical protein n=1 Tax=Vibrio sonorensis TaxID=1004316 RepID=UPI0008DA29E0|nr:hypothetical protein [Vibrio sonorensis]
MFRLTVTTTIFLFLLLFIWRDYDMEDSIYYGSYQASKKRSISVSFNKLVTFKTDLSSSKKNYYIKNGKIYIVMKNSEKEHRKELELIIVNKGQKLICTSCAKFGLSQIWYKTPKS